MPHARQVSGITEAAGAIASTQAMPAQVLPTQAMPGTASSERLGVSGQSPRRPPAPDASPQAILQILTGADAAFDAEEWLRQVQEGNRPLEDQLRDLLQVVFRMQQVFRQVMEVANHMSMQSWVTVPALDPPRSMLGPRAEGSGRIAGRHTSPPLVGRPGFVGCGEPGSGASVAAAAAGSMNSLPPPHYAVGSPRWMLPDPDMKRSPGPVRQASVQGLDARDSPTSPLTRSCSANFPTGPGAVLSSSQPRGAGAVVGGRPGVAALAGAVSTFVPVQRDASPPRSRNLSKAASPPSGAAAATAFPQQPPQQQQHGQQRGLVPYGSGPSLPTPVVPSFPPSVQVASAASSAAGADAVVGLPSPRTGQTCEDGARSPLPAPPGHGALPYPKMHDRGTPNSARTGHPVGNLQWAQAEGRAMNARWEQASPCRVRYVGGNGTVAAPASVGVSAGAIGAGGISAPPAQANPSIQPTQGAPVTATMMPMPGARGSVLGPKPKASAPAAVAATPIAGHALRGIVHPVVGTTPTKHIRPGQR